MQSKGSWERVLTKGQEVTLEWGTPEGMYRSIMTAKRASFTMTYQSDRSVTIVATDTLRVIYNTVEWEASGEPTA